MIIWFNTISKEYNYINIDKKIYYFATIDLGTTGGLFP
jgi:hypothetical protein